jgi:hypothetical protein
LQGTNSSAYFRVPSLTTKENSFFINSVKWYFLSLTFRQSKLEFGKFPNLLLKVFCDCYLADDEDVAADLVDDENGSGVEVENGTSGFVEGFRSDPRVVEIRSLIRIRRDDPTIRQDFNLKMYFSKVANIKRNFQVVSPNLAKIFRSLAKLNKIL